ncbi:MAG: hypothetical protein JKY95_13945 [Planctomycetaceae bacterium]|nr:hypothetical protein [Planctomycetaceae bacterium]
MQSLQFHCNASVRLHAVALRSCRAIQLKIAVLEMRLVAAIMKEHPAAIQLRVASVEASAIVAINSGKFLLFLSVNQELFKRI